MLNKITAVKVLWLNFWAKKVSKSKEKTEYEIRRKVSKLTAMCPLLKKKEKEGSVFDHFCGPFRLHIYYGIVYDRA